MRKKTINRKNIAQHLLEFQLGIVGRKLVEVVDEDKWRFKWTITREQYNEFHNYSIPLLQKIFKFNKKKAEETFKWFYGNFGLRIKN